MKALLLYFSATGNTALAAELIKNVFCRIKDMMSI